MEKTAQPNSFDDFSNRLDALQKEAHEYGIESILVMCEQDRLDRSEMKWCNWYGGPVQALGMLRFADHRMLQRLDEKI